MSRERIRGELGQLITKHLPDYDLSELDDVVVEFVAGMVCSDESDIEQLIEVLNAYIPQLGEIESSIVKEWAVQLLDLLQEEDENEETDCKDVRLNDCLDPPDNKENEPNPQSNHKQHDLDKLGEMFPTVSSDHIVKCLKQANGHMNTAVEFLLMDCQSSQVMTQDKRKPDDQDLTLVKDLILSRYSYVDTTTDKTFHKPHLPQAVGGDKSHSKLRYRDNQVVNTKGERYTIITKKDQEGEHMKHTYISLKPARKYRFH